MTPEPAPSSVRRGRPVRPVRPGRPRAPRGASTTGVAPGVDRAWADAFVLHLRLADVPGALIGDALAEVGSHCAESGESAAEAFGDPVEYARSLDLPAGTDPEAPALVPVVPWVVQTLGLMLLVTSAPALAAGDPVAVTGGHLAAIALLVAALAALGRWGAAVLGLVVQRPVVAWLVAMAHIGLLVAALLLLDDVVARVAAPVAAGVGAAALGAGTLWLMASLRSETFAADPVTAPLTPAGPGSTRGTRVLRYGPALLAPVAAVLLVGVGLLLG